MAVFVFGFATLSACVYHSEGTNTISSGGVSFASFPNSVSSTSQAHLSKLSSASFAGDVARSALLGIWDSVAIFVFNRVTSETGVSSSIVTRWTSVAGGTFLRICVEKGISLEIAVLASVSVLCESGVAGIFAEMQVTNLSTDQIRVKHLVIL